MMLSNLIEKEEFVLMCSIEVALGGGREEGEWDALVSPSYLPPTHTQSSFSFLQRILFKIWKHHRLQKQLMHENTSFIVHYLIS